LVIEGEQRTGNDDEKLGGVCREAELASAVNMRTIVAVEAEHIANMQLQLLRRCVCDLEGMGGEAEELQRGILQLQTDLPSLEFNRAAAAEAEAAEAAAAARGEEGPLEGLASGWEEYSDRRSQVAAVEAAVAAAVPNGTAMDRLMSTTVLTPQLLEAEAAVAAAATCLPPLLGIAEAYISGAHDLRRQRNSRQIEGWVEAVRHLQLQLVDELQALRPALIRAEALASRLKCFRQAEVISAPSLRVVVHCCQVYSSNIHPSVLCGFSALSCVTGPQR
jgi:hypothetical protein